MQQQQHARREEPRMNSCHTSRQNARSDNLHDILMRTGQKSRTSGPKVRSRTSGPRSRTSSPKVPDLTNILNAQGSGTQRALESTGFLGLAWPRTPSVLDLTRSPAQARLHRALELRLPCPWDSEPMLGILGPGAQRTLELSVAFEPFDLSGLWTPQGLELPGVLETTGHWNTAGAGIPWRP